MEYSSCQPLTPGSPVSACADRRNAGASLVFLYIVLFSSKRKGKFYGIIVNCFNIRGSGTAPRPPSHAHRVGCHRTITGNWPNLQLCVRRVSYRRGCRWGCSSLHAHRGGGSAGIRLAYLVLCPPRGWSRSHLLLRQEGEPGLWPVRGRDLLFRRSHPRFRRLSGDSSPGRARVCSLS